MPQAYPPHKGIEQGNRKSRVAMGRAVEHTLGDQAVAGRATLDTFTPSISAMSPERCGPGPSVAIERR
jgi:hypothetical protein